MRLDVTGYKLIGIAKRSEVTGKMSCHFEETVTTRIWNLHIRLDFKGKVVVLANQFLAEITHVSQGIYKGSDGGSVPVPLVCKLRDRCNETARINWMITILLFLCLFDDMSDHSVIQVTEGIELRVTFDGLGA